MTPNVGITDRIFRASFGALLLYLAFFSGLSVLDAPLPRYATALVGVAMLATSLLKFCPLYAIAGINTNQEN